MSIGSIDYLAIEGGRREEISEKTKMRLCIDNPTLTLTIE